MCIRDSRGACSFFSAGFDGHAHCSRSGQVTERTMSAGRGRPRTCPSAAQGPRDMLIVRDQTDHKTDYVHWAQAAEDMPVAQRKVRRDMLMVRGQEWAGGTMSHWARAAEDMPVPRRRVGRTCALFAVRSGPEGIMSTGRSRPRACPFRSLGSAGHAHCSRSGVGRRGLCPLGECCRGHARSTAQGRRDMLLVRGQEWAGGDYVHWAPSAEGMSRGADAAVSATA